MELQALIAGRQGKNHRHAVAAGDAVLSCSWWTQYVSLMILLLAGRPDLGNEVSQDND